MSESVLHKLYKLTPQGQLQGQIEILQARIERMARALVFCKVNNHKDNSGGKTYCRGHECPVCDKIEEAKSNE
jgi:hypothetical protein